MNNVIQFWLHPLMDDNIVAFAITMNFFAIVIIYSTTWIKKRRAHMARFVISIRLLSPSMGLICNYSWVFHDIIFLIVNSLLENVIIT
jgi:hypothetical protein